MSASRNLNLVVRITGDAAGLKAEIVGAKGAVDGLGRSGQSAGQQAAGGLNAAGAAADRLDDKLDAARQEAERLGRSAQSAGQQAAGGLNAMLAAAVRFVATAGSFAVVSGALLAIARAGDTANAAIGRMGVATGSARQALDVYDRLYQLALRTGVSVQEAAGAFQRFAIAAREAGATQAQILAIVQLMQQAGALAGASTQETASATLQLGQALASGRLQGDELRSILEAMPNLADALARELGVGVGELRKLGEEGKLTSETIIPALQRAAVAMNREFERLPPSLERSMAVLGVATTRFLADLDRAIGLSRTLARILSDVAGSLNTMRISAGLGTPIETAERDLANRRSELIQARRAAEGANAATVDDLPDGPGLLPGLAAQARQRRAREASEAAETLRRAEQEVIAAENRLRELRSNAGANESGGDAANAARGAENRRRAAAAELREVEEGLNRRLRIEREANDEIAKVRRAREAGAIETDARADDLVRQIERRRDEDIRKLAAEGRGGGVGSGAGRGVEESLRLLRQQVEEADALTERLRTPQEKLTASLGEYSRMLSAGRIRQETFNRAVAEARSEFERTDPELRRQSQAFDEIGRIGERAFDRIGGAITEAMVQGKFQLRDLNRVGLAVVNELAQAFLRLAVINPIKNAVGLGGGGATLADLFGAVSRSSYGASTGLFYGSGPSAAGASGGGFLFHTGGVVGRDNVPWRAAPPSLHTTAPRYHAGLAPDEMPAILRRGEGVFTPEQMARMGPSGGSYTFAPTIHFAGDAGSAEDRNALLAAMRASWLSDLRSAIPGIVDAAKGSLRTDVRRQGADRALGAMG